MRRILDCRLVSGSFILIVALLIPGTTDAGTQSNAVIALHSAPHLAKVGATCGFGNPNNQMLSCDFYEVDEQPILEPRDVYLVVVDGLPIPGVAGLSCGVETSALVNISGFVLCADLEAPNGGWPASGGGNRITWNGSTNCQTTVLSTEGVHAVAGAFYVYAYGDGVLFVTLNNGVDPPELSVADCAGLESDLLVGGGQVGFGSVPGFRPCLIDVPVDPITWGRVKGAFSKTR